MGSDRLPHLLRRAGFGATQLELTGYSALGYDALVDRLVDYEAIPDDADASIGKPGFVGVTTRGVFAPGSAIVDARQRWLFRMLHSQRPLQEKMTLFWHNHFATGYTKISTTFGAAEATRYMAGKASEDPARVRGQIELLRDNALGNFRDLLVGVAKDVAMLTWLDGVSNTKAKPQENFGRELMELFTMGVDFYKESDVYAAAKVFTGWNTHRVGPPINFTQLGSGYTEFFYDAAQHDTGAKTFTFPIYADGSRTIPERSESNGMQDGLDLIDALAANPNTARSLARKLYAFFVDEIHEPDAAHIEELAQAYLQSRFSIREVVRRLFTAAWSDERSAYARYAWPVELVVRALKEVGWTGFSVNDALTPLTNMGQQLYEPPDVSGWRLGTNWFSSGSALARMNFAAQLASNQKFNLRDAARPSRATPDSLLAFLLDRLSIMPLGDTAYSAVSDYVRAGGEWTGSDTQLVAKASGLVHVLVGSAEYQFV
jgi:uncharacterized protein (DUF1800 family)